MTFFNLQENDYTELTLWTTTFIEQLMDTLLPYLSGSVRFTVVVTRLGQHNPILKLYLYYFKLFYNIGI
jgi:hypothetical protein